MRYLRNKFAVIWLFGLVVASSFVGVALFAEGASNRLNTLVFDTYQQIKPRVWAGSDIVIIDLDEASIKRVGQWPWPRTVIAEMTDKLGKLGAAAIVFDVVFSETDRTSPLKAIDRLRKAGVNIDLPAKVDMLDNDAVLAEAFKRNVVVTGMVIDPTGNSDPPPPKAGHGFSGTEPPGQMVQGLKAVRNLPLLDDAATGIGRFDFDTTRQSDAVVRRATLLRGVNGSYYPILGMEALRVVQGAGSFGLKSTDGSGEIDAGQLAMVSVKVGALEIPTDSTGAMTVYFSPSSSKPVVSARKLLFPSEYGVTPAQLSAEIANHIVLVGTSAAGLKDLRATPLEAVVPGVTVHAEILDQIVSGTFLNRPDIAPGVELMVAIVGALILLVLLPYLPALGDALATLLLITLVVLGFWYSFAEHRTLFSPVLPVFALVGAYAGGVAADLLVTERQSRFVRDAFGRYLAPAMVKRLADNPNALQLGGEEKELTILFCDIRGFTSLSEGLGPTELTELLNNFLTPMTTELLERGATIDKYMGDAIMAFWNAPIDQEDHRARACHGLLDMRETMVKLNAQSKRPIDIGIGLNSGACCVGNLGSTQRFNYSAIGDAVNVASRVEGLTKQYGLDNLVAEETVEGLDEFATIEVDRVGVVGREEPLTVHTLVGRDALCSDERFTQWRETHDRMMDAYRAGDVEQGLVAMAEAARLSSKIDMGQYQKLYAIYGERFAAFRDNGIPEDWDGVYRSTKK